MRASSFRANYYLNSGSAVNDNLYAVGGNVSIAGAISGDWKRQYY